MMATEGGIVLPRHRFWIVSMLGTLILAGLLHAQQSITWPAKLELRVQRGDHAIVRLLPDAFPNDLVLDVKLTCADSESPLRDVEVRLQRFEGGDASKLPQSEISLSDLTSGAYTLYPPISGYTGDDGSLRFFSVPRGVYSLQIADWRDVGCPQNSAVRFDLIFDRAKKTKEGPPP